LRDDLVEDAGGLGGLDVAGVVHGVLRSFGRAVLSVKSSEHQSAAPCQEQCSLFCAPLSSWHTDHMTATRTARERARAELTQEIKDEARRQLAEVGAHGLSLRAVARELG